MRDMPEPAEPALQDRRPNRYLLGIGRETLAPLTDAVTEARRALVAIGNGADPRYGRRAQILARKLDAFEPSVTIVGQVKSGKTALSNVLVGEPGLLPSDVNPWTSVVTSLHLNSRSAAPTVKAEFTFFQNDEWSNLVASGGRLGEIAERAGSNDEMDRIQEQIDRMRAASKARLGANFEGLLGKTHRYGHYDNALIERYVCMGETDDDGNPTETRQGRFADVTKSADIYIDMPEYPGALCLRDTPGVNDTFMVREQITLRSLRGSEICLVVLSAHQALNTTDMALVRLISNFEKRQIVLFVNRVDELANPAAQIPEIRASIVETLRAKSAPHDLEIVFGSAKWAEAALTGDLDALDQASQAALFDWAEARPDIASEDPNRLVWFLSGIPELMAAINGRIMEGSGKRLLDTLRTQVVNLTAEMAAERSNRAHAFATPTERMSPHEMREQIESLLAASNGRLGESLDRLRGELRLRLDKLKASFVRRATDALIAHLERSGQQDSWQYDATGLRVLLRSAYLQFATATKREVATVYGESAAKIEALYASAVGGALPDLHIEPPAGPQMPPPVVVGKTIALDLNGNWWRRWWQRRRGFEAFAADYAQLIESEVSAIVDELDRTQIAELFQQIETVLAEFLAEQREALLRLCEDGGADMRRESEGIAASAEAALGEVLTAIDRVAA